MSSEPDAERVQHPAGGQLAQDAHRLQQELGLELREARAEAELLLMHALGIRRAQLIAHPEHARAAGTHGGYRALLERRLSGEPVAYLLGRREFHGLDFDVTPAVLVPRPDTELLVDLALERLPCDEHRLVADLGTGSGCVAVAIALARPRAQVLACDRSDDALQVARRNGARLGARNAAWVRGDWLAAFAADSFDVIVANPPYIRCGDPHLPALRHEPRAALVSGSDGLHAWRAICAEAPRCLKEGGWLLMEHGYDQAEDCRALLWAQGLDDVFTAYDLGGQPRVSGGRLARRG